MAQRAELENKSVTKNKQTNKNMWEELKKYQRIQDCSWVNQLIHNCGGDGW